MNEYLLTIPTITFLIIVKFGLSIVEPKMTAEQETCRKNDQAHSVFF